MRSCKLGLSMLMTVRSILSVHASTHAHTPGRANARTRTHTHVNTKIRICTLEKAVVKLSVTVCHLSVVYTPANEHFGIVPVEAMYARKPVIACNNGGPTESIGTYACTCVVFDA